MTAVAPQRLADLSPAPALLAWGAKVSPAFRAKVRVIAEDLLCDPNDLMACMAWESGRSFRPDVANMAGSGATGLIQFMPTTAAALGTTTEVLGKLTAEEQLAWVAKYFAPHRGKLHALSDVYMCILYPRAIGQADTYVIFSGGVAYRQNAGLDLNKDGHVTKAEAASRVVAIRAEGLKPGNIG